MTKRYCIKRLYRARHRYTHHDDSPFEDQWQLEVYLHALGLRTKHDLKSVVDIGCGSAYKLRTYFKAYERTGLELPVNVQKLKTQFPNERWLVSDFQKEPGLSADVIICSDVIEHLLDPDELTEFIKRIAYKYLVISTPDRNLLYHPWKRGYWGPPSNPAHQREWAFEEFGKYLSQHFTLVDHRVTNLYQHTQMAICTPKVA